MIRYDDPATGAWVEIAGASKLTFAELDSLYQRTPLDAAVRELLETVVIHAAFYDRTGVEFTPCEVGFTQLTPGQWNWLREQIMQALKDELLPPAI